MLFKILVIFHYAFKDRSLVMIVPVPCHCFRLLWIITSVVTSFYFFTLQASCSRACNVVFLVWMEENFISKNVASLYE